MPPLPHASPLRAIAFAASLLALPASAQHPLTTYADAMEIRASRGQAELHYTIHTLPEDSIGIRESGVTVILTVRNAPDTLRFAIPVWGPGSYRYGSFYRYIRNVNVMVDGRVLYINQQDSTHWLAVVGAHADTAHGRGHTASISYNIHWPTVAAATGLNNYSFLRPDGMLLHGPTTYMYVMGQTLTPVRVTLDVPPDWAISTGLTPTLSPRDFFAPSYDVLIDSPILMGHLHQWRFVVDNVPHEIAYYATHPVTFDTMAFVAYHRRIVEAARNAFGQLPYRDYRFIYEDGPGGGLEHLNSATMGAASERLVKDPLSFASLTAHEYVHAWNVKRVRPLPLGPFDYQHAPNTAELYWAEGVTDFFADMLLRRADLVNEHEATETLLVNITEYLNNPGRFRISPEFSSQRAEWHGATGDTIGYDVSYYLSGALLGESLELTLRDQTNGTRGVSDVERWLFDRFAGKHGYTRHDLIRGIDFECYYGGGRACKARRFFNRYVRRAVPFDLRSTLALAGWQLDTTRVPVRDAAGQLLPDVRARILRFGGIGSAGGVVGGSAKISLASPEVAFARAGIRSGDIIHTINGHTITDDPTFQSALASVRIGDTVRVTYLPRKATTARTVSWVASGYDRLIVILSDMPVLTQQQRMVRRAWLTGRGEGQ